MHLARPMAAIRALWKHGFVVGIFRVLRNKSACGSYWLPLVELQTGLVFGALTHLNEALVKL